jgi:hypothetical protein
MARVHRGAPPPATCESVGQEAGGCDYKKDGDDDDVMMAEAAAPQQPPAPPSPTSLLALKALKTLHDAAPSLQSIFISVAQPPKHFALAAQSTALDDWQLLAASSAAAAGGGAFTSASSLAKAATMLPAPRHVRAVFEELLRRRCDLSTESYPLAARLPVKRRRQKGLLGPSSYRAHLVLAALTDYGGPLGEEEGGGGGEDSGFLLEQRVLRYWVAKGRSKLLGAARGEEDAVLLEHARVLVHIARLAAWSKAQVLQFVHLTYFSITSSSSSSSSSEAITGPLRGGGGGEAAAAEDFARAPEAGGGGGVVVDDDDAPLRPPP